MQGFDFSRRTFLTLAGGAAVQAQGRPDREAVAKRNSPVVSTVDGRGPLSVGNGEFAFTVDVTGLQSIPQPYEAEIPLCTQSQWGWHSFPAPAGLDESQLKLEMFETYGRQVGYKTSGRGQEQLFNWIRENPHRLNLGCIGLLLDGMPLRQEMLSNIEQRLDLWTGTITSKFVLGGAPVKVVTCCHGERDAIGVFVESALAEAGRLSVAFEFPYGSPSVNASDWMKPQRHMTTLRGSNGQAMTLDRKLDADRYFVRLRWEEGGKAELAAPHKVLLSGKKLVFTCEFLARMPDSAPVSAAEARASSENRWARFWTDGASIDLSASRDRRAEELERRVVLSQYLTAIQCSGSAPPQETGLTCNSWYGKFHLEMHWWHAAHFPLWNRTPMLERSLDYYRRILPVAREKAKSQGYAGVRWPKMTDLAGKDSPSNIGELLIWQQPHPIMMAELCYRAHPDKATLEKYGEMVAESAAFMADFAVEKDGRYVLGPPVIPAQENHPAKETWNPTFELSQWREALGVAQQWRERAGLKPEPKWDDVRKRISALPVKDGVYLAHENCPQTFTERNRDHPSMLGALGVLSGQGVDKETMRATLKKVFDEWKWADTWGWDYPLTAMTAARLGEPELAIQALFKASPKNTWLANGHNWQRPSLPLYLPGNGGLLIAVAMMAAAWNGFPKSFRVQHEGLRPLMS